MMGTTDQNNDYYSTTTTTTTTKTNPSKQEESWTPSSADLWNERNFEKNRAGSEFPFYLMSWRKARSVTELCAEEKIFGSLPI